MAFDYFIKNVSGTTTPTVAHAPENKHPDSIIDEIGSIHQEFS
jgi:hypothetical protein